MLSDYNGIKLEISNRMIAGKFQNTRILRNIALNNTQVKEEVLRKLFKCFELNKNENTTSKFVGYSKCSAQREIYKTDILQKKKDLKSII